MLLSLLLACGSERGVREAPDAVTYGGWVYLGLPENETVLEAGSLSMTLPEYDGPAVDPDPDGDPAFVAASQPYEGYGGYWLFALLPPGEPFELRIEGEGAYPSVWAGDTPGANGSWFAGAVFAPDIAYIDELFASLDMGIGPGPGALSEGAIHLWGLPNDGSVWDCAELRVQGARPVCYAFDEQGAMSRVESGAFDWFFAFDLAPGEVVLEDGTGPIESWHAVEGDLVMALWLEHG